MRIVFMGTPSFAVPALEMLLREHDVVAVYTRPDAASGRGKDLRPTPVKVCALEAGVPVEQPATLRDAEAVARLASYAPEVLVVAAYGMLLPDEVLAIPTVECINIHASLLPRWRGAAPIQRAILEGDETAGVSIMRVVSELDAGAYCETVEVAVADLDAGALTEVLAHEGARALSRALGHIEAGTARWTEQDPALVTYATKIAKSDVLLDPALDASANLRRVRASSAQAPARVLVAGTGVTVLEAVESAADAAVGEVRPHKDGMVLGATGGSLLVTRLKPDGKAAMSAADWARGLRVESPEWSVAS